MQDCLAPEGDAAQAEVDPYPPALMDSTDALPAVLRRNVVPGDVESSILTDKDSFHYDIQGAKKVIVFNHKKFHERFQLNERKGTELDVDAIIKTFSALSWKVEVYNDSTTSDIRGRVDGAAGLRGDGPALCPRRLHPLPRRGQRHGLCPGVHVQGRPRCTLSADRR